MRKQPGIRIGGLNELDEFLPPDRAVAVGIRQGSAKGRIELLRVQGKPSIHHHEPCLYRIAPFGRDIATEIVAEQPFLVALVKIHRHAVSRGYVDRAVVLATGKGLSGPQ